MKENSFESPKRPPEYVYIQKELIEHACAANPDAEDCAMNWIIQNGKKFSEVWPKIEELPGGIERYKNPAEKESFLKDVEGVLSEEN